MVPRENKNNAYAKFGGANKEYYGILRNGQLSCSKHGLRSHTWELSCKLPLARAIYASSRHNPNKVYVLVTDMS